MRARARFRRMRQPPEKEATGHACASGAKPRPDISVWARERAE